MKKLFLFFVLVLTVSMNAWAGDYVATDYLNDPYFTKIKQSPTLSDPSMVIYMFLRDPDNGEQCVTWGGYENQNEDIMPKIYIDGELFAQPGWEMCWLNNNPNNGVDTWWDAKDSDCHVYTKEINGVTWTLRFYDVQHDHEKYCVSMYFCPSEIEGGSKHTITVKGRLTEYVAKNTPSQNHYLDVERTFEFDAAKLITSNPKVVKENTNEHALSFYGNLAEGAEKSTYFGVYAPSSTDNRFIPYDNLDGKQELAYATTFSNIKYTIPEEFKGKDLRVQMHRDFSGALGGKVSVCHYYGRFNAAANAIHYEVTEPTYTTVGSLQECWKDLSTGIIYSDIFFENELNPAQVLTYAKFISNPVTANVGFTLKDATYEGYEGVKFNWAAETTYDWDRDTRYVEFTVYGTDVANARLKWTKNYNAAGYGRFAITVYVNGEQKYSVNQNNGESLGGLFAVPLPDLKSGDNVKFEVKNTKLPDYHGTPTIAACLEYTSSNGGSKVLHHEAAEPTYETVGNIEYWEDKTTGQFYSDVTCTQELSPAQVFTYKKLISDPVTANNGFTLKDETYEGVQFNWAAETTYPYNTTGTRYVEFTVYGTDVANARVKWTKNYKEASYGNFTITVYVNGVSVYSVNQNKGESLGGLSAIPLPDLKSGDKVKFEVNKPYVPEWYFADKPAIAACLEYTSSNGGRNPEITITADDKYKYIEQSDPELTWKITKGELMEGDKLTDIKIWRETGENGGLYPIHVSQEEGSNPKYNITFVDGVFRIIDAIHHEAAEPTYTTVGYSQEYWEDRTTGKYYSDAACTKELSPAQVFTYAKFKSNPVTAQDSAFTLKDATYEGVQFNWAAEITYYDVLDTVSRSVEFMVFGTDVANARVKWRKDYSTANYGRFAITVYVNDTQVYSVNQNNGESLGGLFAVPLLDLKSGDKVKFEVRKTIASGLSRCPPTITACLEYTSSNGGEREVILHDAVQPTYETVGNIEYWEDKETGKNYSDAACAKELSPAQVITYTKLISNPVTANNGFTLKDATYEGVQFNWAAERTYTKGETEGIRSVEFTVYGTDVDNARLIWTKDDTQNGQDIDIITITVYVNGTPVYSVKQRSFPLVGIFAIPLPDLKYGDVVKFEVQNKFALDDSTTIAACLEYTSSNGGASVILTADDKLKNKGDDDPELTWQITGGSLAEGDELTGIKIWREEGEEIGSYTIHVSQEEGSNPKYYITFVEGTFRISDIIHHDVTEPTYETVGYLQECWEDRTLGKYYSDAEYSQELNPAPVLSYAKFITNPVTANNGFTLKDVTYSGIQFDWAAETTYPYGTTGTRYVEFTVYGTDVDNARVKWTKNYNAAGYGSFIITVYVNGTQVYSINQGNNALGGLSAIPLPDLKSGDKVKFEVNKPNKASWGDANPTITACLEYTSSNGGEGMLITANQDPDHTENYYSTFWSSTDAYQVPEGVTAYTGKVEDSTSEPNTSVLKLTAIEDGIIPASQGVILRMTTEDNSATKQQIALAKTTATGTWSGTNALTGTDEATTLGANQYALSLGQNGVGFYKWEGKSIGAHKAYLTLDAASAKTLIFEFNDEPSGIKDVVGEPVEPQGASYNLNGMMVGDKYKGIVIQNGKKFLRR